jgi:hypothetical protein
MPMVRFEYLDAALLYLIRPGGCDLQDLLGMYAYVDRAAVPSYEEVAGFVRRAVHAGAIAAPTDVRYELTAEWHARVHRFDDPSFFAVYAMHDFAEEAEALEWAGNGAADYLLSEAEYQAATEHPSRRR